MGLRRRGPRLGGPDLFLRDAVAWRWPSQAGPPGHSWGSRPDHGRLEVRQFIRDNAIAWVQDYRVDGLRFDATAYVRSIDGSGSADQAIPDGSLLLQEVNGDIDRAQPWKLTIAEDMRDDARSPRPRPRVARALTPSGTATSCGPCGKPSSSPSTLSAT